LPQAERFRDVDLHVIDEIAIPDRLEQAVGEAKRQDVLRRLFAQEMIDPEDLLFGEYLVQLWRSGRPRCRDPCRRAFSMMTHECSTRSACPSICTADSAAWVGR